MIRSFLHRRIYGRARWQWLFERLHRAGLSGMNHGWVDLDVDGEIPFLRRLRAEVGEKEIVIFDVGANEGQYASKALTIFGDLADLHCFEPSPLAIPILTKSVEGKRNVHVHPFGLGETEAVRVLYATHPGGTGSSLDRKDFPGSRWFYDKTEKVRIRTLDDLSAELGLKRIDLLKIDTEGHELSVLRGAEKMIREGRVSRIQFEFGEGSVAARTFWLDFFLLLSPRYRLFRLLRDGLRPIDDYRLHQEVFVTTNYVALLKEGKPIDAQ
jgi:FkbM family methyltransferase